MDTNYRHESEERIEHENDPSRESERSERVVRVAKGNAAYASATIGSGWYHDAAIADAAEAHAHPYR